MGGAWRGAQVQGGFSNPPQNPFPPAKDKFMSLTEPKSPFPTPKKALFFPKKIEMLLTASCVSCGKKKKNNTLYPHKNTQKSTFCFASKCFWFSQGSYHTGSRMRKTTSFRFFNIRKQLPFTCAMPRGTRGTRDCHTELVAAPALGKTPSRLFSGGCSVFWGAASLLKPIPDAPVTSRLCSVKLLVLQRHSRVSPRCHRHILGSPGRGRSVLGRSLVS